MFSLFKTSKHVNFIRIILTKKSNSPMFSQFFRTQHVNFIQINLYICICVVTLIKSLKKCKVPKCDIITITGHSTEAGLDPYDSGDGAQQEAISLAIDNINNNTTTTTTTKNIMNHSQFSISPDDPRLKTPCFNFFPPQHQPVGCPLGGFNFSFNNCTVYFNGMQGPSSSNQVE